MASKTTNYELWMPDSTDDFDDFLEEFNENMETIDNNLGGGGGGSGGHTIIDENGQTMPTESKLQFTGNVSVSDDNVNGATVVDVLGGGGNVYGAFIDTSNVIVANTTYRSSMTYTATEDCFIRLYIVTQSGLIPQITIDGTNVGAIYFSGTGGFTNTYYLKKGQIIAVTNTNTGTNSSYAVYGLSQGTNGIFAPVIYSDNERKIGVWRDNKPLYAKTVSFTTGNTSGYLNYLTDIENPETMMIDFGGSFYLTGTAKVPAMAYFGTLDAQADTAAFAVLCNTDNNYLRLDYRVGTGAYSKTAYVTVLYTKTTDVAGSGDYNTYGVPTVHYSTSEQVIGTWVSRTGNVVTLYEKTYRMGVGGGSGTNTDNIATNILSDLNIDELTEGWYHLWDNNVYQRAILSYNSSTKLLVNKPNNKYCTHLVIRYTKTH